MERSATDPGTGSELAWRDDLTGLWNRRYLRRLLSDEWPRLTAEHGTLTLLVLDLDGFKPVNDLFGHAAGDRVLRWAADELRRGFREGDRLIRYGGDEFVVALSGVDADEARTLAERARAGFSSVSVDDPASGETATVPISFSIGVASFPADGQRGEDLLAIADRRLYEEKRARRGAAQPVVAGTRRSPWVVVTLVTVAAGALAATFALREARKSPELPELVPASAVEAPPAAGSENEIVVRDEQELEALRAEVARLQEALSGQRADAGRAEYEQRIRELEERLARADTEAVVAERPALSPEVDAQSGLKIGERRTREELAPPAVPPPAGSGQIREPEAAPPASATAGVPVEAPVIVLPRLLQAPRPAYPVRARQFRRAATVALNLTVAADGRVVAAEPIGDPAGFGFDEAAREAAMGAKFSPGTRDGAPVQMETTLSIRFQLEGAPPRF